MNYIQECMVCEGKWKYTFDDNISEKELEEKLSIIRASCLPCGHQGLFTLKKEQEKK